MINLRSFDENPLLNKVKYELGKVLVGDIYINSSSTNKKIIISDKTLNTLELFDDRVYYGLYTKHNLSNKELEKYSDIYIEEEYINIFNYISLMVHKEKYNLELPQLNFVLQEVFDYLEYMEHTSTLMEYYSEIKYNIDSLIKEDDILNNE